jgi:hypothetical protein
MLLTFNVYSDRRCSELYKEPGHPRMIPTTVTLFVGTRTTRHIKNSLPCDIFKGPKASAQRLDMNQDPLTALLNVEARTDSCVLVDEALSERVIR